jgi:hypothetical protein
MVGPADISFVCCDVCVCVCVCVCARQAESVAVVVGGEPPAASAVSIVNDQCQVETPYPSPRLPTHA